MNKIIQKNNENKACIGIYTRLQNYEYKKIYNLFFVILSNKSSEVNIVWTAISNAMLYLASAFHTNRTKDKLKLIFKKKLPFTLTASSLKCKILRTFKFT